MDFSNRQNRFVRIEEADEEYLDVIRKSTKSDPFYPVYHIAPHHGLMNDPNGLSYFNGEHHIFYQWFPLGPVHGLKYWYHVSTKDFFHYTDHGIALKPDTFDDQHGCYTGVGSPHGKDLYLFYTANRINEQGEPVQSQAMAIMDSHGTIEKRGVVVRANREHYSCEFRDPVIIERLSGYYMLVGAQDREGRGQLALYWGEDITNYHYIGNLDIGLNDFGCMWECPNYFEQSGTGVMILSPQGIASDSKYDLKNVFSVVYMLGEPVNFEQRCFQHQGWIELDKGFDFYAPQVYKDESYKGGQGRHILIGWLGNSKSSYPTDKNNWAHMLTLPRQLSIESNRLVQTPLEEYAGLRTRAVRFADKLSLAEKAFELVCRVGGTFTLSFCNRNGDCVQFSSNGEEFCLDRSKASHVYAEDFGTVRFAIRLDPEQTIRIFVDHSSIEIFADGGKTVFTSRLFIDDLSELAVKGDIEGNLYYLKGIQWL